MKVVFACGTDFHRIICYWLVQNTVNQVRKLTFIVNFSLPHGVFRYISYLFDTIDKYWGVWLSCRNRLNIQRYLRSVLALFVASTEFRRWINVLESQGGFPLSLFSRIRSRFTTKPPKRYIFHPCSSLFDYVDVGWVEAGCCKELRNENQAGKCKKAFWFLSDHIIWYLGLLVPYKKKGFERSCHWKNKKAAPTKAWTQYMGKISFQVGGDYITILPLSVLKAPRPYILKKSMISKHF